MGRTITGPAGPIQTTEAGHGPLVLLVHGFPETSIAWRRQLPALAAAGYHGIAVDLRGCGGSARPAETSEYAILGLVERSPRRDFGHVVGDGRRGRPRCQRERRRDGGVDPA